MDMPQVNLLESIMSLLKVDLQLTRKREGEKQTACEREAKQ